MENKIINFEFNNTQIRTNQTMTSLQISELTGKSHYDLLKSIREQEVAWIKIGQGKFALSSYRNLQNRDMPMYELNRSECLYIATKFNDEARAKLIVRWEELEKPRTHLEVIQSEMALLIQNEKLQIDNNRMKPRDEFVTKVFETNDLVDIGEVAKILKLAYGRNTLFAVLREKGILFKSKNEPYQEFVSKGYFELKPYVIPKSEPLKIVTQTYATQKGLGFIAKMLGIISVPETKLLRV